MLLRQLTQVFGVSGREGPAVELLKELLAAQADEVTVDALGSLILTKKGTGANKKRLMAAAHIDQIGFCVMGVDEHGFVRVRSMGFVHITVAHTHRVIFQNGVRGVLYAEENEWDKNDLTKLFVDIGAKDRDDALSMIALGDMARFDVEQVALANNRCLSGGLDDRIGCYVLAKCLQELGTPYNDVYFSFSVQEELGIRGTRSTAQRIQPDLGIAFDIGGAHDCPGCKTMNLGNAVLGKGASIKVVDAHMVSDDGLNRHLKAMCSAQGIAHQTEVASGGGTDGAMIQAAGSGIRSTTISIPTRYGHSPSEVVDMADVEACVQLLRAACMEDFSDLFQE